MNRNVGRDKRRGDVSPKLNLGVCSRIDRCSKSKSSLLRPEEERVRVFLRAALYQGKDERTSSAEDITMDRVVRAK